MLVDAGEKPAILSRGYGRRLHEDGVVVVSDGEHLLADVDRSGDEPLMLARTVHGAGVFVCDQRAIAGALAERHFGATVHVLDDGFQHRALARDVDIVVVAPDDLDDRPLPFGRLREPVSALGAADAIVLGGGADADPDAARAVLSRVSPSALHFRLRRSIGEVRALEHDRPWPAHDRGPVVALAGIAGPERFFRALCEAGWQVAREVRYRDHHAYSAADVAKVAKDVAAAGAIGALTTEKDAERLLQWRPFPMRVAAVPLAVSVEPDGDFRAWLIGRVREARR
jgi:tetraacyldisaccharide 4'-kinase